MKRMNASNLIAITLAAIIVLIAVATSIIFGLSLIENLVMSWVLTTLYAVFALLIAGDIVVFPTRTEIREIVKEIEKPVYIDREVIKEVQVPIQIPIENKTIEVVEVEKPVYIQKEVLKRIYVERKRKKINIPKYKYLASTQTKTYHKKSCRLGRLIKKKNKIQNNSQAFFKKKRFKSCKICLKRK